ncbi:hypothetical protein [Aggregatilinea lenta]|uniref:hypothetical protein n=1 Tax=Aggregatilinea lenta TaxID=913108 RepID=UPI000E5A2672|nr:hypothetical protein [Aggregatilinea lenta]
MARAQIEIVVDNGVRLLSAALAASNWPEEEQAVHRHRAHLHARQTSDRVKPYAGHLAVRQLEALMAKGYTLDDLYGYALDLTDPGLEPRGTYPVAFDGWNAALRDFAEAADLPSWWAENEAPWQAACEQAGQIIGRAPVVALLDAFCGTVPERLCFMPNVSYPSEKQICVLSGDTLLCVVPPPVAWGDNEPWPFDDDAVYVLRCAFAEYARVLMLRYVREAQSNGELAVAWDETLLRLFVAGAVAVFLEQAVSPRESGAYVLMERRVNGLIALPEAVEQLKLYLAAREAGHSRHFLEYLPQFSAFVESAAGMAESPGAL